MREHFYFLVLSAMETFFSPRTVKGDQLSLLDRVSSTPKTLTVAQLWDAVAGRAYTAMTAIPPAKPRQDEMKLHSEVSKIDNNAFALKVSYMGRSYTLKGSYRYDEIRSHYGSGEDSNMMVRLTSPVRVYVFQNGWYMIVENPSEKERRLFMQAAQDMLSSPLSSRSMTTH